MTVWLWPNTRLTRVIDGDTVDARLIRDIGFGDSVTTLMRLRLARINCPKSSSAAGKAAKARVVELTADKALMVSTDKPYKFGGPPDYAGEYMAEVTLPDGRNLSDLLMSEGLAVLWNGQGERPADS